MGKLPETMRLGFCVQQEQQSEYREMRNIVECKREKKGGILISNMNAKKKICSFL